MSATFPNMNEITTWLDASLYVTEFWPVKVNEYVKVFNELIPKELD